MRRFAIIGEASNHVPEEIRGRSPRIPWADMRAMSDFIVHGHFGGSEEILWDTIHDDLPGIVDPLKRLTEAEAD